MVEQVIKTIPSKGSRLWMMIILELMLTVGVVWAAVYTAEHAKDVTADLFIAFIGSWSSFTQWNVGIYAISETGVKAGEAVMNK